MADHRELPQPPRLPWTRDRAESGRFGLITTLMLVLFLVPALIIPGLHVQEPERNKTEQLPPRLAKLVQPPKRVELPDPVVEPDIEEAQPEPKQVEPSQQTRPEPSVAKVAPKPASQTTEQARETASRSGLFAMKDRLSALTSMDSPEPEVRRVANVSNAQAVDLAPQASADAVFQGSGGIESRKGPVREVELAKHKTSDVAAPRENAPQVASQPEPTRPSAGERTMSNIRQVFDAQKSVLYSLYQRELRRDPTLKGKITLELVIEPDGSVSACDVVGSELGNPMLEKRIALRVQMFNFGAANVETRKVRFPIDFLPG